MSETNYIQQIELVQGGNTETINIGSPHMIEVKYNELKQLRDNGRLVEGAWYRLTDYECVTFLSNSKVIDHPFDIIILALSSDTLSEECRAIENKNTDYFSNCNLSAWKVWYQLGDGSTYKKGHIYRLIDEHGNDCPYDFKNIAWQHASVDHMFTFDDGNGNDISVSSKYCFSNKIMELSHNIVFMSSTSQVMNNYIGLECNNLLFNCDGKINNVSIGDTCASIVFGAINKKLGQIVNVKIGFNSSQIGLYDTIENITIGDECKVIKFNRIDKAYKNINIENGVDNVTINSQTTYTNEVSNIHIHKGVKQITVHFEDKDYSGCDIHISPSNETNPNNNYIMWSI